MAYTCYKVSFALLKKFKKKKEKRKRKRKGKRKRKLKRKRKTPQFSYILDFK